jgi:hypothetical protein
VLCVPSPLREGCFKYISISLHELPANGDAAETTTCFFADALLVGERVVGIGSCAFVANDVQLYFD